MKKVIAFLTAVAAAFTVTGCGKDSEKTGATLEISLDLSYISEEISYSSKTLYPEFSNENGIFFSYTDKSKERAQHAVFWDAASGEFSEMELHSKGKKHGTGRMLPLEGGKIGIVFQNRSSGIRNWEFENADAYMDVYNSDFTYAETIPFSLDTGDEYAYDFCSVTANGAPCFLYTYSHNKYIYHDDEDYTIIMVLDGQMQYMGEVRVPSSGASLFQGASGDVYVETPLNVDQNTYTYSRVDLTEFRLEPIDLTVDKRFCGRDVLTGTNGYEFYTHGQYGMSGVTISGNQGTSEQIIDFRNSDFLDWLTIAAAPDGRFIIMDDDAMWLSRKRTEEEKNIQVITMAGVGFNEQLEEVVNRFNRTHSDYRIAMVDYTQFADPVSDDVPEGKFVQVQQGGNYILMNVEKYEQMEQAAELFMQDLMNGIAPDIICTDHLPYVQLANKGLFLDMTELMEQDERFNEEDYVMPFFDSMKYKGQQQTIAFSFYINTIAGKTELVGDRMGLSSEEYLHLLENRPDEMLPFSGFIMQADYKERFLPWVQNSFLDTENKKCNFNSAAFVKLLELGNMLYSEEDQFDYEAEWQKEKMLYTTSFSQPIDYRKLYVYSFDYADMNLVGYPMAEGGNGCIFSAPYTVGINAMSKYQDVVWDVFMELLDEGTQRYLDIKPATYSFPVLRSALEEDLTASTKGGARTDGRRVYGCNSEEDIAFLMDYIEHTTMFNYTDPAVTDIITEETEMYFAGDQTAEEAAGMIQSRVSIYLSEQY